MRAITTMFLSAALMCVAGSALADETAAQPVAASSNLHPMRYGFGMDLGVPSGISLGFVLHPKTDLVSLQASVTENVLSPGGRLSVKLDPMALMPNLSVGLLVDVQGGFAGRGSIPGNSSEVPSIGYDYVNFYAGLRLGKARNFHWLFEAGPTYLAINTSNFASLVSKTNGLTLGNPTGTAWVTPTFITGFEVQWP